MAISISTLRIEAALDASQYVSGGNAIVATNQKIGQSAAVFDQTERRLGTSSTAIERLQRTLDPAYSSTVKFEQGVRNINRAMDQFNATNGAAGISAARGAELMELLRQRYSTTTSAVNDNAAAHAGLSSQSQAAMHSIRSMAEQLALGVPPTQILTQQLNHLSYAASGPGGLSAAFGGAVGALKSIISPTTVAVAGLVAVAGGFAFVISKAIEAETRVRSFRVILDSMGTSSLTTAANLEKVVEKLRDTGSSIAEATAAAQNIARTPGVDPRAIGTIADTARNLAAARGTDFAQTADQLAKALAGGADAMLKFDEEMGVRFLPGEQKAINLMLQHRDANGLVKVAFDALTRTVRDDFQNSLSGTQKLVNSLDASWNNLIKTIGDTGVFDRWLSGARLTIQQIDDLIVGRANQSGFAMSNKDFQTKFGPSPQPNSYAQWLGATPPPFVPPATQGVPGAETLASGANYGAGGALTNDAASRLVALGATQAEIAILAQVRQRESSGAYNTFHATGDVVSSLDDVRSFDGKSHAFGAYGFQPGTFESMAARTGRYDISPYSQDANALALLRQYGPNSTASWAASMPRGGYPTTSSSNGLTIPLAGGPTDIAKQTADITLQAQAYGKLGQSLIEAQAKIEATRQAEALKLQGTEKDTFVTNAVTDAVNRHNAELEKAAETQRITNSLALDTASAFGKDEVSGLRAAAAAQAELAVRAGEAGNVQAKTAELLRTSAAEAIGAGAKALPGLVQQTAATQRLAEAAKSGAGAEHEAAVQNQITAATHDALTKAIATGDPALISRAQKLRDLTAEQIKANDAAQRTKDIQDRINERTDQISVLQLQAGLQGQTPEVIAAATAHLQEQQRLLAQSEPLNSDIANASLANVDALSRANIQLAAATRESQRWDDAVRGVASSIESTLTGAIEAAFSGQKVDDWGKRIKNMLGSLVSQISDALFIKPLLGSLVGALGFGNVASSLGTFGGLFGGGSGSTLTGTVGGQPASFNLSNVSSGLGVLDKIGSSFGQGGAFGNPFGSLFGSGESSGGGLFSGVSDFFSNNLGGIFARTGADFGGGGLSGFAGATGFPDAIGGTIPGLFGDLTLGGAFTGIGGGFGAGMLLNSLLGGNKLFGGIGSGLGGLAGTLALGPLGGILGGALGGLLGGLFGNNKPRNQSAGANFDLSNFKLTAGFAGGNSQIDQQTQQVAQSLQSFLALLKTTGGALSGNVLLQNGVNTGFTADSSLPGYSGRFNLGKDPTAALQTIELALSKSLTGISDTMRTVLDQISDPAELEGAIAFASAYDSLKTAADDAFKSVENGKNELGPFRQAMDAINATFGGLTDQANRFGLALSPIDAALAEATTRLQGDFTDNLKKALNTAQGKDFLNQLTSVWDNYLASIKDSQAIGLGDDRATQDLLGQVATAQLNQILDQLDTSQLDQVTTAFAGLNDTITGLADTARDAAGWTDGVVTSLQDFRDSVSGGSLSGLSTVDQLAAANDNFQTQLDLARNGDASAVTKLISTGQTELGLASDAYGNGPKAADLRTQILSDIDALLAGRSHADGGWTSPGWNRVGERGAEWLYMPSSSLVLPNGTAPPSVTVNTDNKDMVAELRTGNRITQAGLMAVVQRLERLEGAVSATPIQGAPRTRVA